MRPAAVAHATCEALGVIPARYASTRFPGKPLALLAGKPMVQHVWERARQARALTELLVATEDERIVRAVEGFGGRAVMTSRDHVTGTDRLAEVAGWHGAPIVVNIQGDEPLLEPEDVDALVHGLSSDAATSMATLSEPLEDERAAMDPNVVKVVCDTQGRALYFSRAPIPYPRTASGAPGAAAVAGPRWLRHVGVYAYRREFLLEFASWAPTPLETLEALEQLRALEHGHALRVFPARGRYRSVDTPEDLQAVESALHALTSRRG
jgi:3-deoxy-manno-octulosonate cytidylyltransferase (CMP-KDO synthetase)